MTQTDTQERKILNTETPPQKINNIVNDEQAGKTRQKQNWMKKNGESILPRKRGLKQKCRAN